MAASKPTGVRTVLLLSHSDVECVYPRVNEFPIPVKFLVLTKRAIRCEFYPYYDEQMCGLPSGMREYFRDMRRFVYLPFLSSVQAVHRSWIMKISRQVEYQLIISSEKSTQVLRDFPKGICNVVIISSRGINVPEDRYSKCGLREDVTTARFFDSKVVTPPKFPKNRKYIAGYIRRGSSEDIYKPEIVALLDVYRALNNTVDVIAVKSEGAIAEKSVDLLLFPLKSTSLEHLDIFLYSHHSPLRLCFFTKIRRENRMIFIDSWESLLQTLFTLALAAVFVVLCVLLRTCTLLRGTNVLKLSHLIMFLLSTFFGRSHSISNSQAAAYRSMAVVSWFLGMLILGSYVQTSITAIRVVRSFIPPIRTLEELSPYADECLLAPCVSRIWEDILAQGLLQHSSTAFPMLRRPLYCKDTCGCGENISGCYEKAHAGTHFALSSCSDEEVSAASQWGLTPSIDLATLPQVAGIHALNPARYQHRRILLAIAEHGFEVAHRRRVAQLVIADHPGAQPFELYGGIYLVGCAMSCVALAAELLWRLTHRPTGGRYPAITDSSSRPAV
ncbi:hypothetical protein MTO96_000697 [Rhipicephalus appendiculatus]